MGVNVILQDELGRPLAPAILDERNVLPRILEAANADTFPQLQYLDLYGHTTFNQQQMDSLAQEWSRLTPYAKDESEKSFLNSVAGLIERGREKTHQYLKFVGD